MNIFVETLQPLGRNTRRATVSAMVLMMLAARSSAQFEGVVESKNMTIDQVGRPQKYVMTMWIKKDMVKIETSGSPVPGSTMIYRTDQKRIYMINQDEKSYFEISQDEKPQEIYGQGGKAEKYSVKRTGKSKSIAGYPCEQFIIKRGDETTELWGTKKLQHIVTALTQGLGQQQGQATEGAAQEVMKFGVYPMFSATKIGGVLIEQQEVTRVEPKTLDSTLFAIPAGFKKQKSIDMMQGLDELKK